MPKCPKCGHTVFRAVNAHMPSAEDELQIVMCAKCETAIGVAPAYSLGTNLRAVMKKLGM
jgi:predicted  nucleic acid-binding Zn-ribbon protein